MNIISFTINLGVEEISQSARFYREGLGFELVFAVPLGGEESHSEFKPDTQYQFAMLAAGTHQLMLQDMKTLRADARLPIAELPGASATLFIEVSGLEEVLKRLQNLNFSPSPISPTWYGMNESYVADCDGYIICLAEKAL